LNLVLLSLGGAMGAMARYKLGAIVLRHEKHTFPLGTFLINITGALLLGIICGLNLCGNPYLLLGDGFCGAFTTFSTFSVESVRLIQGKAVRKSMLFIILSLSVGLGCFFIGYVTVHALVG
jgi:fluoride exporter